MTRTRASESRACVLVVPGSIEGRTGGYEYDRRIAHALQRLGWSVEIRELDARFPRPAPPARRGAAAILRRIPDNTLVVIDGLALGAMPDEVRAESGRLCIVGLVHLPLADEVGLDRVARARLEESEATALAAAGGVVVTGTSTVAAMQRYGVPPDRIAIVEPGTDRAAIARGSGGPLVHLVSVAAVTAGKGHETLMNALARVPNRSWRLTCAGSLERDRETVDRFRSVVHASGLDDQVSLVGELRAADIAALLDSADLFVLATLHETFGMAVAEALARGVPVIATSTGAIPELVGSGEAAAGIVVPPGDVDALAAALSRVIGDRATRDRLAGGARRARERLRTWDEAGLVMSRALERFARPALSRWLQLREPFDHAARSEPLTRAVVDSLPHDRPVRIVDLATGTGSNVRYLAPRIGGPQEWLLVDGDRDVLTNLPPRMEALQARARYETRQMDLGDLDASLIAGRDLVTASALLDLVSPAWMARLARMCRAAGASVLLALTYNGRSSCSPAEPEDDRICELLNRHQRANDKGFGRAAGPDAVDCAERAFAAAGYRVRCARSDWQLPEGARELQRELVRGWADAAIEIAPEDTATIEDWLERRLGHIDAGQSRIAVCHEDLAAWPH